MRGADDDALAGGESAAAGISEQGNAEVDDLHHCVAIDQQIFGFYVAVNDAHRVHGSQAAGHLRHQAEHGFFIYRLTGTQI